MNNLVLGCIEREERKRLGLSPKNLAHLTINLGDPKLGVALRADAKSKGLTINALMRAMVRGYLAEAYPQTYHKLCARGGLE